MDNDLDTPAPLPTRDVTGVAIEPGHFVLTTGCDDDDDMGEVIGALRGRVLVSWPIKVGTGYRYSDDWHPADDIRVIY